MLKNETQVFLDQVKNLFYNDAGALLAPIWKDITNSSKIY